MTIQKYGVWLPISKELIADGGWPNRCFGGWPCFIHTKYVWYCGDIANPFAKEIAELEAQLPVLDRIIDESRERAAYLRGLIR